MQIVKVVLLGIFIKCSRGHRVFFDLIHENQKTMILIVIRGNNGVKMNKHLKFHNHLKYLIKNIKSTLYE